MQKLRSATIWRLFVGFLLFLGVLYAYSATLALVYGPNTLSFAYGCRWDCGWYQKIMQIGYVSTIPPVPQNGDQANVAFFPLYPIVATIVGSWLKLPSVHSLPITSAIFALGIFLLIPFLYVDERGRPHLAKIALLLAFPATFYFFTGYSESIYIFLLFLGIWLIQNRSTVHPLVLFGGLYSTGFFLGMTRLTGFVIPGAIAGTFLLGWLLSKKGGRAEVGTRSLGAATLWTIGGLGGAGVFFLFCHLKFGVWNLYFQTLDIGWHKEFDVPEFFRLFGQALRGNLLPPRFPHDNTLGWSWTVNLYTIMVYLYAVIREVPLFVRKPTDESQILRTGLLLGGFAHLLITTIGDSGEWHYWMNGMRYTMPALFLLILLWNRDWTPTFLEHRPRWKWAIVAVLVLLWLPYQIFCVYRFTQNHWVS